MATLEDYEFRIQKSAEPSANSKAAKPGPHHRQAEHASCLVAKGEASFAEQGADDRVKEHDGDDLLVLKAFDLNHLYGPVIGVSRLERLVSATILVFKIYFGEEKCFSRFL